jgi:hypothetical protein
LGTTGSKEAAASRRVVAGEVEVVAGELRRLHRSSETRGDLRTGPSGPAADGRCSLFTFMATTCEVCLGTVELDYCLLLLLPRGEPPASCLVL